MKPPKNKVEREIEIKKAITARNRLIQLSTNCSCELDNNLTKKEVSTLLNKNTKIVSIQCYEFDKYGRLLVSIFDKEQHINNILIEEGFAKNYNGGTKII
jgi:hypothetical protein